ncbi:hypothetical protein LJC24_02170 [Desulfococcaceae bacterium OttesenSCG-928-F15]|nr:hypothetical protein [Desulfococcaceae bacterium OttesenSCG-928-F15]
MIEFLYPNDAPIILGMNSHFIEFDRLFEYYQKVFGSGCIVFKNSTSETVVFFNKDSYIDCASHNEKGFYVGFSSIVDLKNNFQDKNFRVSVYAIPIDTIPYWCSLLHAEKFASPLLISLEQLSNLLKNSEKRPETGYFRVQGQKRRELGWIFFQKKRIVGFLFPGEKNSWMGPEAVPDFLHHFHSSNQLRVDTWNLLSPAVRADTVGSLSEWIRMTENFINDKFSDRVSFATDFKKACAKWADTYDFLDPFLAEVQYTDGHLSFAGKTDDCLLYAGIYKVLQTIMDQLNQSHEFQTIFEEWGEKHSAIADFLKASCSEPS